MATFYWRGATANHPNSYDYNIASNWYYTTKINTSNSSTVNNMKLVQATSVPGYGDIVKIGVNDLLNQQGVGATFSDNLTYVTCGGPIVYSPVSLSPLLYGGFSGGAAGGFWANGVGATGTTGTTATSALTQFIVSQDLFNVNAGTTSGIRANNKYPFTSVGGGIDYAEWELGLMGAGATAMRNIGVTGTSAMADHYTGLRLKVNSFLEFSPYRIPSSLWGSLYVAMTGHNRVDVNFVKNIDSIGLPCTNVIKGDISTCTQLNSYNSTNSLYWSAISTPSYSSFMISGFVNNINAKHASGANLSRFNSTTGVLDDGRTKIADCYNNGYLGLRGVTASSVSNYVHSYTEVSANSTVGQVSISSLHGWLTGWPVGVGGGSDGTNASKVSQFCEIFGEINNKKAKSALGYTGSALGQTGEGNLLVDLDFYYPTPSDRNWKYGGSLSNDTREGSMNPTIFIASEANSTSKIDQLIVNGMFSTQYGPMSMVNPTGWTQGANISIGGSTNIGTARLDGCFVFSNTYYQGNTLINFGSLYLTRSALDLRTQPEFNSWSFGVTSGAAGATSVVGGIFGDDKSVILTSNDISLFNKSLRLGTNKTINRDGIVSPLAFEPDTFGGNL